MHPRWPGLVLSCTFALLLEQGRLADAAEAFGHCLRLDAKRAACREGQEATRPRPPP